MTTESLIDLIADLQAVNYEIGYKDGQASHGPFSCTGLSQKIENRLAIREKIQIILGGKKL